MKNYIRVFIFLGSFFLFYSCNRYHKQDSVFLNWKWKNEKKQWPNQEGYIEIEVNNKTQDTTIVLLETIDLLNRANNFEFSLGIRELTYFYLVDKVDTIPFRISIGDNTLLKTAPNSINKFRVFELSHSMNSESSKEKTKNENLHRLLKKGNLYYCFDTSKMEIKNLQLTYKVILPQKIQKKEKGVPPQKPTD